MIKMLMIGYIGKDATINEVQGTNVINFSVCHTEQWTDKKGEKQQRSQWADCSYWSDKTGVVQYLKKGTQVYVEGTPSSRAWVSKDGEASSSLTLRVFNIQLLGGNAKDGAQTSSSDNPSQDAVGQGNVAPRPAATGTASLNGGPVVVEAANDLPF